MANKGFYLRDTYLSRTAKLTDEELGRLMRACMVYHATGEETELEGRESIAFDFIREDIDEQTAAYDAKCETNRRNRMGTNYDDGQRPSTTVNDREEDPTAVPKVKVKVKVKEKVSTNEGDGIRACAREDAADAEAYRIQAEHNEILEAAVNAGFPKNTMVRAQLIDLYAQHGKQKMITAITDCAEHSASSVAYLKAVLTGKPKKSAPAKTVIAQQYSQRDYSGIDEQKEFEETIARLERMQKAKVGEGA